MAAKPKRKYTPRRPPEVIAAAEMDKRRYVRKPKRAPTPEGVELPVGRPTSYTKEAADFVCDVYETGTTPLTVLCRERADLPTYPTIVAWQEKHEYFFSRLQRAERQFARNLAEHTVVLADAAFGDVLGTDKYGRPIVNNEIVARSKLKIGVRQWLASRMDAGRWGDRSSHAITGADGGPVLSFVDLVKLSTAARKPEGDGSQ